MSKSFFNDNLLPVVREILKNFKRYDKIIFLTSEVIKEQIGRYVNDNCSPSVSFNANYGKFLKEHSTDLKIKELRKDVNIKDKYGNKSTCSEWKIIE